MTDVLREVLREQAQQHEFFPEAILSRARVARRRRRVKRLGLALAAGAATVAVAGILVPRLSIWSDQAPSTSAGDGPVIAVEKPLNGLPQALIIGTLELRADCLVTDGHVLVFADPGTTWDAASQSVVTPDGETFAVGSRVRLGGGYMPLHDAIEDALGARGAERARACLNAVGADEIALASSTAS